MEAISQMSEIFNYEDSKAESYKKFIDSIKGFRMETYSLLVEKGVDLSGAYLLSENIRRVVEENKDYYVFNLVPKNTHMNSRKIKFLIKENGLIKFTLYENNQTPMALNPEWRELNVEIKEGHPELYESTALWLKRSSFNKTINYIAEFIKENN